jgi:cytidylate kinase
MAVITMSRMIGSRGETVADIAAEKLGYELFTSEDAHRLAQDCNEQFKEACRAFESEMGGGMIERFFMSNPAYTALFKSLNYEAASRDNIIILGRGAQIVLANEPGVLRCRVIAPFDLRVSRIAALQGLTTKEAEDLVNRVDHQRGPLIESVFHHDLSDVMLYDLIINTSQITPEIGGELVVETVNQMGHVDNWEAHKEQFKKIAFAKEVESAIKTELISGPHRNIEVEADGEGVVILTGFATHKTSVDRALRIASSYPNVTRVINRVRVTDVFF